MMILVACLTGFVAGAALTYFLCQNRAAPEETTPPPGMPKTLRQQYDNFLNYDGSGRGQRELED